MHSTSHFKLKNVPLVGNAWIKPKMQNFQPRASQIDKIQHRMLHLSKTRSKHTKMAKPHKVHARTAILIIRPSQTPTSTSCHVKATEPCTYFYLWDFSLIGIMQRFSTQSKLNSAHRTWEHIFQAVYIPFSDSKLVHEMSLRQKGTYAPPLDKARGLNIHDGKWAFGPIWSIN
jgi:hypothetical protein